MMHQSAARGRYYSGRGMALAAAIERVKIAVALTTVTDAPANTRCCAGCAGDTEHAQGISDNAHIDVPFPVL
jgi:hypothetical protein